MGFFTGLSLFRELSRPGVKDYLEVGGKKSLVYALMFIVPAMAFCFILWQDWQTRRIESRHRSR